jgi:hypothetical protein
MLELENFNSKTGQKAMTQVIILLITSSKFSSQLGFLTSEFLAPNKQSLLIFVKLTLISLIPVSVAREQNSNFLMYFKTPMTCEVTFTYLDRNTWYLVTLM